MNPRWEAEHPAVASESLLDTRGVAQVVELLRRVDLPAPRFVYHELAVTDGAGHDYGPHDDGLADALTETDIRIGRVLAELDEAGLFEETLFVVTADHGMAPQMVELKANTAAHVTRVGLAAVVAEPLVWLLDVAVDVERKPDGRTGRVAVHELDPATDGERPAVEGAEVLVESHEDGLHPTVLARGHTDVNGLFAFPTPNDVPSSAIAVSVRAAGFNPRHVLMDGTNLALDLRSVLYGD
jgi:hypothetical protein